MSSDEEMDVEAKGVEAPDVVTKYRTAAEIADKAMSVVAAAIVPGASVVSVCQLGDEAIVEGAGAVYNKARTEKGEKVEKGIAFPTCVSVNNCICHFSPLSDDTTVLKEGDIVSIDLGCHIDGYIALEAKSMLVNDAQATGRAADAMMAAYVAAEAALRVLRPGKTNYDVTETINRAANQFNCKVVEGSLSHQMKRFVIDGNKVGIPCIHTITCRYIYIYTERHTCYVHISIISNTLCSRRLDSSPPLKNHYPQSIVSYVLEVMIF